MQSSPGQTRYPQKTNSRYNGYFGPRSNGLKAEKAIVLTLAKAKEEFGMPGEKLIEWLKKGRIKIPEQHLEAFRREEVEKQVKEKVKEEQMVVVTKKRIEERKVGGEVKEKRSGEQQVKEQIIELTKKEKAKKRIGEIAREVEEPNLAAKVEVRPRDQMEEIARVEEPLPAEIEEELPHLEQPPQQPAVAKKPERPVRFRYFTIAEYIKKSGKNIYQVKRLIKEGKIKTVRVGKRNLIISEKGNRVHDDVVGQGYPLHPEIAAGILETTVERVEKALGRIRGNPKNTNHGISREEFQGIAEMIFKIQLLDPSLSPSRRERVFNFSKLPKNQQLCAVLHAKAGDEEMKDFLWRGVEIMAQKKIPYHLLTHRDDLMGEMSLGFLKTLEKYKLKKGVKDVATFSTYLDYWLVQHMNRWLQEHSRTIRIPFNRWGEISEYHHAHERLTKELEREPEIEEMAEYMGKSVKEIEGFFKFPNTTPLDRKVRDQHGSSDSTLSDFISCGDMDVTKAAEALFREDLLGKIFEPLTTRERIIVKLRFGIKDDEVPETLEEVGIRFKLTRERIRQIEFKALQKLRKNQQSRKYLKRLAA